MSIFPYSLLQKILKLRRPSLGLVFLIKIVYNQFLLLKNYRLWHWMRSFIWFIPTNLKSVIYIWLAHKARNFQLEWSPVEIFKVWCKKGSVKKRKTSNNRSRVFEIALEGGREWKGGRGESKLWLGEIEIFDAFVMLKATFSKHLVKLAWGVSIDLKYDAAEVTAAANEDCIGWLLESCCLIGKKWNFWQWKI